MIAAHLRDGGTALVTSHGAHVAPPAPTRTLWLGPQQATVPERAA